MANLVVDQYHLAYFNQVDAESHVSALMDLLHRVTISNQLSPESNVLVTNFEDVEVVIAITEFGLSKIRWLVVRNNLLSKLPVHEAEDEAEVFISFAQEMNDARHWAETRVNSLRTIAADRANPPT